MKLGKSKWLVSLTLAGGLLCSSYNVSYANSNIDKVINQINQGVSLSCDRNGSLRSSLGVACNQKYIAAFAVMLCKNQGGFKESHCNVNAIKVLGPNYNNPQEVLIQAVKNGIAQAKTIVCSQQGRLLPDLQDFAAKTCSKP
jgi:hypothetical protein